MKKLIGFVALIVIAIGATIYFTHDQKQPFPLSITQILMTIGVCVACGGMLMAALMIRKKKMAKQYQKQQEEQPKPKKDEIQP